MITIPARRSTTPPWRVTTRSRRNPRSQRACRFSSLLSPGTAPTWDAAGCLIDLPPAFPHRSVIFLSARRPPDLPGGGQPAGTGGPHGESVVAGLAPVSNREPEAVVVTGVPGGIGYPIAHAFATPRVSPFVSSPRSRSAQLHCDKDRYYGEHGQNHENAHKASYHASQHRTARHAATRKCATSRAGGLRALGAPAASFIAAARRTAAQTPVTICAGRSAD